MNRSVYENRTREHLDVLCQLIKETKWWTILNKPNAEASKIEQSIEIKLGPSLWFTLYPEVMTIVDFVDYERSQE